MNGTGERKSEVCVLCEVSIQRQSDGRITASRVKDPCELYAVSIGRKLSSVRKGPPESFASRYPRFADIGDSASALPSMSEEGLYLTVFETIMANSSKLSLPSPSLSASIIVLSTICCS